ncbi:16S rRNA (cytosine(967)-C(5))-methyltransferase RsmB [Phorcysia thermohydrogeniphila]|uniref:16S rRNA (cytosine(967)-C(5))-methyltransferase RsmB n=1 Tax=Phorcysia thermohydrogeniphila TaxID=936138 RepID=UPI001044E159|nr:16S rRNA (cytosine(967)-C(5))-methyltransferase RsmB [Phorcysia thermohydrogeniphila]
MIGWKSREIAIKILNAFEKDKKLREHVEKFTVNLSPLDRAFIREIASGTVRYLRLLDFSLQRALKKNLKGQKPSVRNALRLIAYQLFFTGVPAYAAVNETVEAVKRLLGKKPAGFVNAASKKLLGFNYRREVERIPSYFERISTLYSFETWMVRRWARFYGKDEIEELLKSLNKVAPLCLRVNRIKVTPEKLFSLLESKGIEVERHPFIPDILRIKGRVPIESLPGYKEGYFYIQDPASFLAAYLLDPKPSELILDVGAAPGGKTTAIASITENRAKIVAVDVNKKRMELLKANCKKLGVKNVSFVLTDISKDRSFREKFRSSFDRILIDAPCSATGVIRRHPEGKWNKSIELIRHNQKVQRALLKSAYELLKPGGVLLFSVCSLEQEEGEENAKAALNFGYSPYEFSNLFEELKAGLKGNTLRVFPHRNNMDGFFYAIFRR